MNLRFANAVISLILALIIIQDFEAQVNFDSIKTKKQLGSDLMLFEDESSKLKLNDVLDIDGFKKATSDAPNFNSTDSAIWGKIEIATEAQLEVAYYLQFQYPILDSIQVWEIDNEEKILDYKLTGSKFNFDKRELETALPTFEIHHETKYIFFRVKSPLNLNIPTVIIQHDEFIEYINDKDFAQGMYAGFMIFLIVIVIFLGVSTGDKTFWAYVGHLIATAFITLHLGGYAFKYAWPDYPIINEYEPMIFGLGVFSTLFSMAFLNTVKSAPTLNKWLLASVFINLLVFPLSLLGFNNIANQLVQAVGALGCFLMLIAGIILYRRGYKPARFFVAAWSLFLIGVIISILQRVSILPFNEFTLHASQIGSTVEALLLTFALSDKVLLLKKEKEQAQRKLLEETQNKVIIEKTRKKELAIEVEKRTKELIKSKTNLEKLSHKQTQLLRIIGHDVRGPLANITMALDIALEDKNDVDISILKKIRTTADASKELLENLLLWATTNTDVKLEKICLKRLVNKICNVLELNAVNKKIDFEIIEGSNTDFLINGNKRYIETSLRNILSNAIKFSEPQSSIKIEIINNGKNLELNIIDRGIGMSKEAVDNFNNGKKLKSSLGTKGEIGTGLGLQFVRDFIFAQNANVTLSSKKGQGTKFSFQFPID